MTQEGMVRLGRLVSGAAVVLTVGAMAIVVLQGHWELAANVLAPENALIGVGFGALAWTLFPSEPRNGARPSPPATTRTSPANASSVGHTVPYGPRRPIVSPGRAATIALLTAPTARTVSPSCQSSPAALTDTGISPTPNTHTIAN